MHNNQRFLSGWRRVAMFVSCFAVTMVASMWLVQPTGTRYVGSAHGTIEVTDSAETSTGSWVWLAVRSRNELNLDRFGAAGDAFTTVIDTAGLTRSTVDESDIAARSATLDDAWVLATRYATCADLCPTQRPTVELPSSLIGGSIGVVATLAYIDYLTPGDLTGGLRVAVTGAVTATLTDKIPAPALPVGGVDVKLEGSERAGADLTLIPTDNVSDPGVDIDARNLVDNQHIVAVATVDEALTVLCSYGSTAACALVE